MRNSSLLPPTSYIFCEEGGRREEEGGGRREKGGGRREEGGGRREEEGGGGRRREEKGGSREEGEGGRWEKEGGGYTCMHQARYTCIARETNESCKEPFRLVSAQIMFIRAQFCSLECPVQHSSVPFYINGLFLGDR